MNGTVIELLVEAGELVQSGQPVLVLEAMKMQHTMHAPVDGVVDQLFYKIGDLVDGGASLVSFQASE